MGWYDVKLSLVLHTFLSVLGMAYSDCTAHCERKSDGALLISWLGDVHNHLALPSPGPPPFIHWLSVFSYMEEHHMWALPRVVRMLVWERPLLQTRVHAPSLF